MSCAATILEHDLGVTGRSEEHQGPDNQRNLFTLEKSEATQCKCSQEQEAEPPNFVTSRPQPQALPAPRRAPRPAWRLHLSNLFDELATVVHPRNRACSCKWRCGMSTMIHTQNALSRESSNWIMFKNYGTLTFAMSWLDRVQRHQPMRVLNVLPSRLLTTHVQTQLFNIILEQGLHPQKVAIHFTTILFWEALD